MSTRVVTTDPRARDADVKVVVTVGESVGQSERDALEQAVGEAVAKVLDGRWSG